MEHLSRRISVMYCQVRLLHLATLTFFGGKYAHSSASSNSAANLNLASWSFLYYIHNLIYFDYINILSSQLTYL